ncbi:MAG: hypothetical protein NTZ50_04180 [Chloroflexi bacterium]|nr:hypothetical protein [Chloroflexota bacterium]
MTLLGVVTSEKTCAVLEHLMCALPGVHSVINALHVLDEVIS